MIVPPRMCVQVEATPQEFQELLKSNSFTFYFKRKWGSERHYILREGQWIEIVVKESSARAQPTPSSPSTG
jgi:hypothetical protein